MQDNTERLRKTLSSNNKSHSGNIRAVVDHHAYYVTNNKTGIGGAITAISTTLVGRQKPRRKKNSDIGGTQYIARNQLTYKRKVKLSHKKGEQRKISCKESIQINRMEAKPQPDLKHVTKIGNGCARYTNKTLCEKEKAFFINMSNMKSGTVTIYTRERI